MTEKLKFIGVRLEPELISKLQNDNINISKFMREAAREYIQNKTSSVEALKRQLEEVTTELALLGAKKIRLIKQIHELKEKKVEEQWYEEERKKKNEKRQLLFSLGRGKKKMENRPS